MKTAGINGFGRFGLRLLKYWLDRSSEAAFAIQFINDDFLTIDQAYEIILHDKAVVFNKYKVQKSGDTLTILEPEGKKHTLQYTHVASEKIPWIGKPEMFFECSGKNTMVAKCEPFLTGSTELVMISATSWDAPATLIYGFNHTEPLKEKILSYGSCTVNAFVPLAHFLHEQFGIVNSDVNVIHNIQEYRLKENYTLIRKFCTLEKQGPALLPFLNSDNFIVNYTVVPYTGVSIIDFRFQFKEKVTREKFLEVMEHACAEGELEGLYDFDEVDVGPEKYNCTTFSTVFIKEGVKVVGDYVYLQGYFDNENSVNRYYDLAQYLAQDETQE